MKKQRKSFFEAARQIAFVGLAGLLAVAVTCTARAQSPRYTGANTGLTSHLTFEGGGGFTIPAGSDSKNINVGYNILLGGGYMLNKRFGALAEWNFNRHAIPNAVLQEAQEPGGNYHFWTASIDPIYNYWIGNKWGGYGIGGGGFSRKLVSFTQPFTTCYPSYFGCYPVYGNVVVYHYSSNQAMVDIGSGVTFRFSPYNRTKLFMEARVVKLFTSSATQLPGKNVLLVPVTFGVRW